MDFLAQRLDEREKSVDWHHTEQPPAARLLKFDAWARKELARRIDWTWAGSLKERRIEQARIYLEKLVLDLWRRGWMLDGERLAARLTAMLDTIGRYQKAGAVRDFWPYYCTTVRRYVGLNSEELQAETLRAGSSVGQAMAALLKSNARASSSLPELLAQRAGEVAVAKEETLREQQARLRAQKRRDDAQQELL